MDVRTIEDIKRLNESRGYFFFNRESMRAFNSRILSRVMRAPYDADVLYFVTSERYDDEPRKYTLRSICVRQDDEQCGMIDELGGFQQFDSAREAYRYATEVHNLH